MKSTGPPLRARRWPARSRSTAPVRSPSASARLGFGAQRAQRQAEPRPSLAERAPGERVAPDARRPRSAALGALAFSAALSGAPRARDERDLRAEQQRRPRAVGRIGLDVAAAARGAPRSSSDCACSSTTARSARALAARAARAPAPARRRATRRRAPSRAAGSRRARSRSGAQQLVGGRARDAVAVERLPAAQRVDARVHQHACARLRRRCARARSTGAERGRRGAERAHAPRRCARSSAGGCAGRGSRRCRSGATTGPASRTSRPCRPARSRRRSCTCRSRCGRPRAPCRARS